MTDNNVETKKPNRILVANRGEIAVRIVRAIRELGLESVAIYSDADRDSMHVRMADFAVNLPGNTSAETYLNIPTIIEAIKASGANGVHPGYGFLAESAEFNAAVVAAGVKFIGPSVESMGILGDKIQARDMAIKNDIPIVPGIEHALESVDDLRKAVDNIGLPVILKAAAGGGGRGMRIVYKTEDLEESFEACRREAVAYFGNGDVFCERYLENPRHIEFQVLFDGHGNGVHLFERDCSVQRRNQKLFEEAPSTYLSPEHRERLGAIAVKVAQSASYEGAGTVEFICESPEKAYFMEMNTRIQVEHPVTEWITGVDLISEQIRVARGEELGYTQADLGINGWSFEARINAEIPSKGFLPAPGRVTRLRLPSGPNVRVDSHLYQGYEIPSFYDSMVAKLIVWGRTREDAVRTMKRALGEIEVSGVPTTSVFHENLLQNEKFLSGNFTTKLVEEDWDQLTNSGLSEDSDRDEIAAILATCVLNQEQDKTPEPANGHRAGWTQKSLIEATRIES